MKKIKNQQTETYKSIRVKSSTKSKIQNFLAKVNKSSDGGKISFDQLVSFLLENTKQSEIDKLVLSSLTWVHEEKRLRLLYEKKKGTISDSKWKQMLFQGELLTFTKEHSRIPISILSN